MFFSQHPGIDLQLVRVGDDDEISDRIADAFITTRPSPRGYRSVRLMREQLVAVGSPSLGTWPCPLITTEVAPSSTGSDWVEFCRGNGLALTSAQQQGWKLCTHYSMALEMAQVGIGAALVPDFLASRGIADGSLVRLPGEPMSTGLNYYMAVKFSRHREPALVTLTQWLRAAAQP